MKHFIIIYFLLSISVYGFDPSDYYKFVEENKDMSRQELLNMYPSGKYYNDLKLDISNTYYLDSVDKVFDITKDELELLAKNGFFVSKRFELEEPFNALKHIFVNDLPVYVSADIILYGLHYSVERIIQEIEKNYILNNMRNILIGMRENIDKFDYSDFKSQEDSILYNYALNDLKVFIEVSWSLINNINSNNEEAQQIINLINSEQRVTPTLFSSTPTPIDFSQFKVRGFYEAENLGPFFRLMKWFGRIELNITNAENTLYQHTQLDLDRMLLHSSMLSLLLRDISDIYIKTDDVYKKIIGRQDNLTPIELLEILDNNNIMHPSQLLDNTLRNAIVDKIKLLDESHQTYLSNVLFSRLQNEKVVLPIVFKFFGDRPILDGFVTSQVVYSNIEYKGTRVKRKIPKTLDVLFTLGSNPCLHLLEQELDKYNYSTNLAGLRKYFDSMDDEFWNSNIYNSWLNILRSLSNNDEEEREKLPNFARTAAWHQKSLTTQLASWSQLRRDFILSAKQPYSGALICSFPYSLVEPNPDFFRKVLNFVEVLKNLADNEELPSRYRSNIERHAENLEKTISKLLSISIKQVNNIPESEEELEFLQMMLIPGILCSDGKSCNNPNEYKGWFFNLFYDLNEFQSSNKFKKDYIVADYHTVPTINAEEVGMVLHAGTGPFNYAFVIKEHEENKKMIYVGLTMSYFEYSTYNYNRLSESDWAEFFEVSKELQAPVYSKFYLSSEDGKRYNDYSHFNLKEVLSVNSRSEFKSLKIMPNPTQEYIYIQINIPNNEGIGELFLYDINGNRIISETIYLASEVNNMYKIELPTNLQSGVYFVEFISGNNTLQSKFIKN